jgi:surface protein
MFHNASSFNQPLNVCGSTRDLSDMFYGATRFNALGSSLNHWNTSQVETMKGMFCDAKQFNAPVSAWDTSKVSDMSRMFCCAHAFNQPLEDWDLSSVRDMKRMFYKATAFNQSVNSWAKYLNKSMEVEEMFQHAPALRPECVREWDFDNLNAWFPSKLFYYHCENLYDCDCFKKVLCKQEDDGDDDREPGNDVVMEEEGEKDDEM